MISVVYGRLTYVKLFVQFRADVKVLDAQGKSLLHIAAWNGHHEVLDYLLKSSECKAILEHLECCDADGRTPLHIAGFRSPSSCCEILLEAGADASKTDKRDAKPAELAGRVGRKKSKELLDSWELSLGVTMAAVKMKGKLAAKKAEDGSVASPA